MGGRSVYFASYTYLDVVDRDPLRVLLGVAVYQHCLTFDGETASNKRPGVGVSFLQAPVAWHR